MGSSMASCKSWLPLLLHLVISARPATTPAVTMLASWGFNGCAWCTAVVIVFTAFFIPFKFGNTCSSGSGRCQLTALVTAGTRRSTAALCYYRFLNPYGSLHY